MPKKIHTLNYLLAIVFPVVVLSASAGEVAKRSPDELIFGIVPQQSATTLAKNWVPIIKYLSEETGLKIRFQTAKDIPAFESRVLAGAYDIAYMNPFHYVTYSESASYRAFAHQSNKRIKGIVVKQKQSKISSLLDLETATIAFPSPAAFAASLLPRAKLDDMGVSYKAKYVGSHDSVYRAVAKGIYPAGGGIERTFRSVSPDIKSQLDILWTAAGFTPHAFAAHPRVSTETVNKITDALVLMQQSETGRALLSRIKFKGIQRAQNSAWDDVRALKITPDASGLVIKQP